MASTKSTEARFALVTIFQTAVVLTPIALARAACEPATPIARTRAAAGEIESTIAAVWQLELPSSTTKDDLSPQPRLFIPLTMIQGERIKARLDAERLSQADLARAIGVSPQAISKLVVGGTQESAKLYQIAKILKTTPEYLQGETDDPTAVGQSADVVNAASEDDVEIDAIDLAYGMGGTFLDNHDPDVEKAKFSRAWLRQFTDSPPDLLFSAQGIGDSMWPTIHDRDVVIGDRSSRVVDQADKIWAVVYGGVGMIKRLRPLPDGTVRIMSDNPQVSDELATDGDLHIVGRVAAIVRRV